MTTKKLKISILSYFYIALVLHGLQRMSGLFIIELLKIKSITYQDAAAPFIYSWAVAKIVASLSTLLIDKKSSELVVFCAVLLCAMGSALCTLDTDITSITVFWGFIFGSGHGLASPHLKSSLAHKDSSKLSFLYEIPSSFGISIMPFLFNMLVLQYGLQGSCIILSGLMLQYVPLALASVYNIVIRVPNIKWRVRKKNSQYSVSKQEGEKTISNESFINSLEPDFVSNVNQCDDCSSKLKEKRPEIISNEILPSARKRSGTRINDLQDLEIDRKIIDKQKTYCQIIPEEKNCEKIENVFEECFSNMNSTDVGIEFQRFKNLRVINSEVTHNISTTDNVLKPSKCTIDLQNKVLENISQDKIKETECKKNELKGQCLRKSTLNDEKNLAPTHIKRTSTIDVEKDHNKCPISVSPKIEQNTTFETKQAENISLSSHKFYSEKLLDKETTVLSPQSDLNTSILTLPLDIKVHVEEYTFTVDKECRSNSLDSNFSEDISYQIDNSQCTFLKENEWLNAISQNASRNALKDVDHKSNLSKVYSVSNNPKSDNKAIPERNNNKAFDLNIYKDDLKLKFIKILKFLSKIISPVCICIVVTRIIFDTSLIILLTNIDYVSDQACFDFKWILLAFGVGGLFGKLCCCKISKTISEKFHTTGVVLFLLIGLSIAGILYSPNLGWLISFYSILGALEGGISYILPKFIMDYTHKEVHHMLSFMETLLSGIAIICLPSLIGLLPDEMGNYEFLLQTLSCLSILCAFLAYFLPHLRKISHKRTSKSLKEMESV